MPVDPNATLDSSFFPLGLIAPTPGTPLDVFQNFTAVRDANIYVHLVLFQAHKKNQGIVYIGKNTPTVTMSVATNTGIHYQLMAPGDSFSMGGGSGLNVFELAKYRVDVDIAGDGVFVSIYFR